MRFTIPAIVALCGAPQLADAADRSNLRRNARRTVSGDRNLTSLFGAPANAGSNGNGNSNRGPDGNGNKDYIITFSSKDGTGPGAKCQALAQAHGGAVGRVFTKVLNGCSATLPRAAANALKSNPNIASIEEDGFATASTVPSWGLDRINQVDLPLDGVTEKVNASGVKVYILDTGVYGAHSDFTVVLDPTSTCHFSPYAFDGYDNENALVDGHGHGTHVGSTACGNTYGVAENCELCAVKVLKHDGFGSYSAIIAGFDHVANQCSDPAALCVLNASLGGSASSAVNEAVANAVSSGVVVVVAAGNENTNACTKSPASEPSAITVGSTTETDGISYFSNYGSCVDVYAPGHNIVAAVPGGVATNSGTSMASPHVAGIAAGVLSSNPNFTPFDVGAEIKANTVKQGIDYRTADAGLATTFFGADQTQYPTQSPTTAPPTPAPTPCPGMTVEVKVKTDNYPGETAWTLTNQCGTGETPVSGGYYNDANTMYSDLICLQNSMYQFQITDTWGDGICCSVGDGAYEIWVDGVMAHEGGEFGSIETKMIGACDGNATTAPTTSPPVTSPPVTPPPVAPTPPPVAPTPAPTNAPTPLATDSPTFFTCSHRNQDMCTAEVGCQWIGTCHNCGCVPLPRD